MMFHLSNHLWMILTPLPLLGEGGEPAVHQHLVPLGVVTNDPCDHLSRDTLRGAGAQHHLWWWWWLVMYISLIYSSNTKLDHEGFVVHLLIVVHGIVARVHLLHQPELFSAVRAGGGGANSPCGTLQTLIPQPLDQADGAVHGGVPHLLHLGHRVCRVGVTTVDINSLKKDATC